MCFFCLGLGFGLLTYCFLTGFLTCYGGGPGGGGPGGGGGGGGGGGPPPPPNFFTFDILGFLITSFLLPLNPASLSLAPYNFLAISANLFPFIPPFNFFIFL